jgi:hypothetical protein
MLQAAVEAAIFKNLRRFNEKPSADLGLVGEA